MTQVSRRDASRGFATSLNDGPRSWKENYPLDSEEPQMHVRLFETLIMHREEVARVCEISNDSEGQLTALHATDT